MFDIDMSIINVRAPEEPCKVSVVSRFPFEGYP